MFGPMLRAWRRRRGASQLALALQSGVSQRHVSFLESGRAKPSREMVVQLSTALDVPLRQRNTMLLAAGFAPAYRESNLGAPELTPVRQAIDRMLKQQEPYPAVVIDRLWNLQQANEAAQAFTVFLFEGPPPPPPPGKSPNILRWLLDPKALRAKVSNWEEVARYLVSTTYAGLVPQAALRGAADAGADGRLSRGRQGAVGVHHHRHAGHATGHHSAGSAHRVLLPRRRAQRRAVQEPRRQGLAASAGPPSAPAMP
jgi:transcriptional regulator with XRE-family HTH domain